MAIDTRVSFYGIGIDHADIGPLFFGISINHHDISPSFYGIGIEADLFFNGTVKAVTFNQVPIANASVTSSVGDIKGLTDAAGKFPLTGSTTVGNLITIEKEGKASIKFPPPVLADGLLTYCLPEGGSGGSTSKKVYVTNKGNTLINPNDTILIELD